MRSAVRRAFFGDILRASSTDDDEIGQALVVDDDGLFGHVRTPFSEVG